MSKIHFTWSVGALLVVILVLFNQRSFAGGFDFRDNFVGRYQAYQSSINGLAVSPSLGYRIGDKLSVGVGVSALYTIFNEEIAVNQAPASDGKVKFEDLDDWSAQGFLGLTFQITPKLMLGGLYRSKSDVDVEGKVTFKNIVNPIEKVNLTPTGYLSSGRICNTDFS